MITTTRTIGVMTAVCLLFAAPGYAEDYQVRLDRPSKAGDVLQFVAKVEETNSQRFFEDEKLAKGTTLNLKAHVEGELEILAVDKKGRKTRLGLTIRKLTGGIDGKAVEPLAAGSVVIVATAGDKITYQLKDGKLPKDIKRLLGLVIVTHKESDDDSSDGWPGDKVFGTSARKKVGDKWPVNKAAMAKLLKGQGMIVKEGDISGTVEITELRKVNGVPCLHMKSLVISKLTPPPLPEGSKVAIAKITTRMTGDFPVDLKLPPLRQRLAVNVNLDVQGPAGGEGPVRRSVVSGSSSVERELTPGREKPKPAATTKKAGN